MLATTEMLGDLKKSIDEELTRQFGSDLNEKYFAVRSSAIGEDSAELSTAGQLETFLDISVEGVNKIIPPHYISCQANGVF